MKKVMRKLSVLALVCCMVLGLGIGVRANTSAVSSRAASTNLALGATATANDVEDGTSFTANLAIDGNSETRWAPIREPEALGRRNGCRSILEK